MKRLIGAILVAAMFFLFAACGSGAFAAAEPAASETPVSTTSRKVHTEPVTVTETYAKADVVAQSSAASSAATSESAAASSESTQASSTPATGDFPLVYILGAVGLILFCSAGLFMLRRI